MSRASIHAELRRLGRRVNRKRIARVMRERGIRGVTRRKRRSLTRPDAKAKPAPDLIGRDFHAERPGIKLVGDITYLPTTEGWLYLACWLDLATREVVGYAMADHHRAELVVDALDMAHGRGNLEPGCVIHSDRGSEYTSSQFRYRIGELGLRQSCGRTGSCFDNATAESFWAMLKEEIGTRTWPDRRPPAPRSSPSRDLLQPPPPAQAQDLRLPHPGRDPAAASTHSRGITIECPRSRGNFIDRLHHSAGRHRKTDLQTEGLIVRTSSLQRTLKSGDPDRHVAGDHRWGITNYHPMFTSTRTTIDNLKFSPIEQRNGHIPTGSIHHGPHKEGAIIARIKLTYELKEQVFRWIIIALSTFIFSETIGVTENCHSNPLKISPPKVHARLQRHTTSQKAPRSGPGRYSATFPVPTIIDQGR
ncbi:IS3 family transposase [Streptomyces hayashii]|uniref:IS3 family transposase n=1 Tax=Streptomyces TaxID=1883 RepID=UPI002FEEC15F